MRLGSSSRRRRGQRKPGNLTIGAEGNRHGKDAANPFPFEGLLFQAKLSTSNQLRKLCQLDIYGVLARRACLRVTRSLQYDQIDVVPLCLRHSLVHRTRYDNGHLHHFPGARAQRCCSASSRSTLYRHTRVHSCPDNEQFRLAENRAAFCLCGLKPASTYASAALLPSTTAWANFSCRGFFRTGIFDLEHQLEEFDSTEWAGDSDDNKERALLSDDKAIFIICISAPCSTVPAP